MSPYAAAVRLYPRRFREEYGADLLALAAEMRQDLGRPRAAVRLTCDLLVSLPARHLEVAVKRSFPALVPVLAAAVAVGMVALAAVLGSGAGLAILLIALVAAVVAALAYPSSRVVRDRTLSARWWQLLLLGGLLLGAVAGGQALFDSDSELVWPFAFLGVLGGWACVGAGLILAVVRVVRRHPATP